MSDAEIPVTTDPLINAVDEEMVEAVPAEIEDFVTEHGLNDRKYTCNVKQYPAEGGSVPVNLPWNHNSKYPTAQELGENFGPGKYLIMFGWMSKDHAGKNRKHIKEFKMVLGEQWADIAMEKAAQRMIASRQRMESMANKENLRRSMNGQSPGDNKPMDDGISGLRNSIGVLKDLGVPIGGALTTAPAPTENMGVIFQAILAMQQTSSDNMMKMMMQQSQQSNEMMIALLGSNNNKPQTHDNAFKEVMNLVQGMTDMKSILSPEKKSSLDRLYDMLEGVLPGLIQMTAQKRAEMGNQVKMMPEVANIGNDSTEREYMVEKFDKRHGQEQTDMMLATFGWDRPGGKRWPLDIENRSADELAAEALAVDEAEQEDKNPPTETNVQVPNQDQGD